MKPLSRSNLIGLPKLFADKGFNNFDCKNDFLKSTCNFCKLFYQGETEKQSLVLCGNVGNGKTHLAIAILKNLIELPSNLHGSRKQNALFLVADEFFMLLNDAAFEKKSKLDLIKNWLNNEVVCLDDLGTYNMTSAKIENLYTFINHAYLENKRIIITTNFAMKEFDQYDKRIGSRLSEMAHIIAFQEQDFRKIKQKKESTT
ncbi:MAG: ATP-binding protein [Melioribacter sp.]|nr:ATP-binding protein [Melioribacter sp.]